MITLPSFYIYLLIVIAMFLAVVWAVNLWVKHKTWHDDSYVIQQIYNGKRLFILYVRCWVVVLAVFSLLYWVPMDIFMVVLVFLLAALAVEGIIQGESLAESSLLQSQSENLMLRSQLNPHFLYNTLNNIDALIWIDQEKASAAVTELSGLMRYITYSARQDSVQIGQEVEHLRQLVELQRLRMSLPASLTFTTQIDNPRNVIAPLLLLPLIENCFKHCGDLNEPDAIQLSIVVKDGVLDYRSSNNLPGEERPLPDCPRRRKGIGMMILRRRLTLLYGDAYQLEAESTGTRYLTHLQVRL